MLCSRPQESGLEYTFIRIGEIVDGKEGGSVMVGNVTDELPVEQVVRDDIIRLSAEAFVMENTTKTVSYICLSDGTACAVAKLDENETRTRRGKVFLKWLFSSLFLCDASKPYVGGRWCLVESLRLPLDSIKKTMIAWRYSMLRRCTRPESLGLLSYFHQIVYS